jgi:catechol 2,3-dioxygenase
MNYWGSAAFLSTAGYHHHIGLNTWESLMGGSHVNGYAGLEYFTVTMPDSNYLQPLISRLGDVPFEMQSPTRLSITDPDGIKLIVSTTT